MLRRLFYNVFTVGVLALAIFGQSSEQNRAVPSTCEEVRHTYDESIARSLRADQSMIIFVFREGRNENRKALIAKRMDALVKHIRYRKGSLERFVFATGEKSPKLGTLDIYIEGKLEWQVFAAKNSLFGSDCIESKR